MILPAPSDYSKLCPNAREGDPGRAVHQGRRHARSTTEHRGAARGPLLVFINSLGTDFRIWDEVAADLAADFAVLCYDKRGHGLSDLGDAALHDRGSRVRPRRADRPRRRDATSSSAASRSAGSSPSTMPPHRRRGPRARSCSATPPTRSATPSFWNQRIAPGRARGHRQPSPTASSSAGSRRRSAPASARRFAGCAQHARPPARRRLRRLLRRGARRRPHRASSAGSPRRRWCVVGDQDGSTPPDLRPRDGGPDPGRAFRDHRRTPATSPASSSPPPSSRCMRDFFKQQELLP